MDRLIAGLDTNGALSIYQRSYCLWLDTQGRTEKKHDALKFDRTHKTPYRRGTQHTALDLLNSQFLVK